MLRRFGRVAAALAALVALVAGGSTLASAKQGSPFKRPAAHRRQTASPGGAGARHAAKRAAVARKSSENPGAEANDSRGGSETAGESDGDATAQARACSAAGIDPNADNVQYDDATGTCSLDGGDNAGPQ